MHVRLLLQETGIAAFIRLMQNATNANSQPAGGGIHQSGHRKLAIGAHENLFKTHPKRTVRTGIYDFADSLTMECLASNSSAETIAA